MNREMFALIFGAVKQPEIRETASDFYGGWRLPQEKDLVQAHLVVELMDQWGYPPGLIHVNYLVGFKNGGEAEEVDVLVMDAKGNARMIFLVEIPENYFPRRESAIDRLYSASRVVDSGNLSYLCYYTRWYEKGAMKKRVFAINRGLYPTKEAWIKAGKPCQSSLWRYQPE
ncbi:MAG: hypothetical protein HY482_02840 [Candidatus Wildermuthbacteria bacterium]|nr:hypothetical protein [Candidatus Wildermuthbacteria bacterium]